MSYRSNQNNNKGHSGTSGGYRILWFIDDCIYRP